VHLLEELGQRAGRQRPGALAEDLRLKQVCRLIRNVGDEMRAAPDPAHHQRRDRTAHQRQPLTIEHRLNGRGAPSDCTITLVADGNRRHEEWNQKDESEIAHHFAGPGDFTR